jgi:hypothetical protein
VDTGDDGVVGDQVPISQIDPPGGLLRVLAINDPSDAVPDLKSEAELFGDAQGPGIVQCPDQNDGPLAELGETGLRGGLHYEFVVTE